jgi:hypothetical protein
MPSAREQRLWARQMRLLNDPLEAIFATKYRALMKAMRADSSNTAKPFNRVEWRARVVREMQPFYVLALQVGARSMLLQSPTVRARLRQRAARVDSLKGAKRFVIRYSETLAERLADTVDTTYDALSSVVEEAVADGLDAQEIADLIESEWSDVLGDRTDMIALTETQCGLNSAREYVAEKVIETWKWVTAADERVRENHVIYGEADAKPVGFNYATLVGGTYTLRYPADPECDEAGEVVNCRCITVPDQDIELSEDDAQAYLDEFDLTEEDLMGGEDATPSFISNPYG